MCCTRVSSVDISAIVKGKPLVQHAHGPCVEALVFHTIKGKACVDPKAEWTKDSLQMIPT
ncbi:hypothetical protein INR49_012161 [Caranx melampygus]|nr:hypothetical protein INR49_012161 [Caranx melampygus]